MSLQSLLPHLTRFRLRAHRWIEWRLASRPQQSGSAQPRVRAVGTARERCIVSTGARWPTCRWPGPRWSCTCRSAASSAGTPPVRGGFLPSGFPPSSRSVAATVWACVQPSGTWASRLAAVPARGSRAPWASRGVIGRSCVWSMVRPSRALAAPRVIGLDEWAWRRGRRFGTIVCDLERHHVLDLLPERSAPSVAQWLQAHPERRDRLPRSQSVSMPKGFGRGRRRRSRSSIGSTWCGICATPWSGSFSAIGGT